MYSSLCLCLSYYLLCYNHFSALGLFRVLGFLLLLLFLGFGLFVLLVFCYCLFWSFLFWGFFSEYSVKIERKLKFSVSSAFAKGDICSREKDPALRRLCFYIAEHTEHKEKDLSCHISFLSLWGKKKSFKSPI